MLINATGLLTYYIALWNTLIRILALAILCIWKHISAVSIMTMNNKMKYAVIEAQGVYDIF